MIFLLTLWEFYTMSLYFLLPAKILIKIKKEKDGNKIPNNWDVAVKVRELVTISHTFSWWQLLSLKDKGNFGDLEKPLRKSV